MKHEKQFGELSVFTGRDVELYRSSDMYNTALYFTRVPDSERKNASAFFEILRFGFHGGAHQIYIRFPNTDYFVEMVGGGMGNAHGDMKQATGENYLFEDTDPHFTNFKIYSHDKNLVITIGGKDYVSQFNFMRKVAEYNNGNPFDRPPVKTSSNMEEINAALKMKYLKLPDYLRRIEYVLKTKDENPRYFITDFPAFNFRYDNHGFYIVENGVTSKCIVKKMERWRDGGTTFMDVVDENGGEHKFFVPQRTFPTEEKLVPKWDNIELEETSENEKQEMIELLKIDIVPDLDKQQEDRWNKLMDDKNINFIS